MDAAPGFYEDWVRTSCAGESRRCGGGDKSCQEAAKREGFDVRVGLYQMCRREDVVQRPGVTSYGVAATALVLIVVGGMAAWRRRKPKDARQAG